MNGGGGLLSKVKLTKQLRSLQQQVEGSKHIARAELEMDEKKYRSRPKRCNYFTVRGKMDHVFCSKFFKKEKCCCLDTKQGLSTK